MARFRINDDMQAYPFWLLDISPNLVPPLFALNPLLGFAGCSAIEIQAQNAEYRPVDRMFPVSVPESASVSAVTLRRGSKFIGGGDFYRWIDRYIRGEDQSRRNLLLIHFLTLGVQTGIEIPGGFDLTGPVTKVIRPPGRAWVLWDCVPTRYNSGEFDASSGQVVIQELDVQPGNVTQVDLDVF